MPDEELKDQEQAPAPTPEEHQEQAAPEEQPAETTIDTPPDPASMKAEIERLESVKKKAEEDARYWREQKARARADFFRGDRHQDDQQQQPQNAEPTVGPNPADFDDYNKYVEAKISHEVNKAKSAWDRDLAERARRTDTVQREASFQAKLQEGFDRYQDFEEVALAPEVPITAVVHEILQESDMPADVAYYLGKNRPEAVKIARMTPVQAARAIAKIEARIEAHRTDKPPSVSQPPRKTTTAAPPPIRPIGSGNTLEKDPDKMSLKEYEAWRRSQGARLF